MTALHEYNQKRNFERTLEPQGIAEETEELLRFAIQHHLARKDHYDLRLEHNGALLSWAVPKGPSCNPKDKRLAVQVEDHPLEYRHFEGTIPHGEYGGGTVMLWDEGYWEPLGNVAEGLQKGSLKFILHGKRLQGKWALVRMQPKPGEHQNNWLLLKEKDEYVKSESGISAFTSSIKTGRSMKEIEAGEGKKFIRNPFSQTAVQLAKLVHTVPKEEGWLYEMKYDGYRILAYVEGNHVRLMTRNGNDYTRRFPDIALSLAALSDGRAMVLDGELAVVDAAGKTDFQGLQDYLRHPRGKQLTYIVFDLLALDGDDLRGHLLTDRKERLEQLLAGAPGNLHYSRHVIGNGAESLTAACAAEMEGIVGKRADSIYSGTRNGDWIKLKCSKRQEFVIGGYTRTEKKASGVSALLLGVYDGGELVYTGRAGTGISGADMMMLEQQFAGLIQSEPPFNPMPETRSSEKTFWLRPELVAEIKFAEWTNENLLRQASFKGLRTDKDPQDVKREKSDQESNHITDDHVEGEKSKVMGVKGNSLVVEGIEITSPDKVMYDNPVVTKEDVARYYQLVSERMLAYAGHRILSTVRCPKGISKPSFYKKHPQADSKGVVIIPVETSSGKTEEYYYIEDALGLLYEVQMCTLEFHTWGSRAETLEKPDMMVFDLDPDEGMELDQVRQGVRDVRSILNELSLKSYLKTSGGKGYHVVVPLEPSVNWDVFHDFARSVAEVMEQKWPDRYTSNVRKAKRSGRIFIDWIRNGWGATSVAPYSLRARAGAKVSMPILWEELDRVAPDGINMADAIRRITGCDPWDGFFRCNQRLK